MNIVIINGHIRLNDSDMIKDAISDYKNKDKLSILVLMKVNNVHKLSFDLCMAK